jgi:Zn-dependent peptidase ImmA (M78 family)
MELLNDLRFRMEKLISDTIKTLGLNHPFSPEEVAEKLGLTIQNGHLQHIDGFFHDDSKTIVINESVRLEKIRLFTIFHEICHYLLRNDDEFFSDLNDLFEDDEEFRCMEEKLCNVGASEFLAPRKEVVALIEEKGFSIHLLFELEESFQLSKQSAMWRLAECANHPCILSICRAEFEVFPVLSLSAKEIKVENAWNSDFTPYKLRKQTPIPKNHHIWNTVNSSDDSFSFDDSFIPFYTGNQMSAKVEGIWINGRAYIVFHLN